MLVFSVLDALTQQMGTAAVTQFTFAQAVQQLLRYASDRAGWTVDDKAVRRQRTMNCNYAKEDK